MELRKINLTNKPLTQSFARPGYYVQSFIHSLWIQSRIEDSTKILRDESFEKTKESYT